MLFFKKKKGKRWRAHFTIYILRLTKINQIEHRDILQVIYFIKKEEESFLYSFGFSEVVLNFL